MGDFSEHVLFGLFVAAAVAYLLKGLVDFTALDAATATVAVFVGSVLPDIDHTNSYVYRSVKAFVSLSVGLVAGATVPGSLSAGYVTGALIFVASYLVLSSLSIRHRGFTHTASFCATVSAVTVTVSVLISGTVIPGIALGLGIFSHLLLDRELF